MTLIHTLNKLKLQINDMGCSRATHIIYRIVFTVVATIIHDDEGQLVGTIY